MLGCTYGTLFQTTVAGGSYQEGLTVHLQGVPVGLRITEAEIYEALLTRKPGQSELASPRREPDVPIIFSGVNAADTMPGFSNRGCTNGTPMVILIPNLDRHFEHIEQYQATNRTPRPGHASYASYQKYGEWDDAIGAGFFSGRYTSTIVAAGAVARHVLKQHGIEVFAYVKEAAGVRAPDVPYDVAQDKVDAFRTVRREYDPIYDWVFRSGRITPDMRLLHKMSVLAELERDLIAIQDKAKPMDGGAWDRVRRLIPTRTARSPFRRSRCISNEPGNDSCATPRGGIATRRGSDVLVSSLWRHLTTRRRSRCVS